jgi:CRISPR/Cas system CMR-associated protein Cmr3 (group 5 of RAMP superfamily)
VPEDIAKRLPGATGLRLGGEGREAHVVIEPLQESQAADVPRAKAKDRGLIVMLETPGIFLADGQAQWCLPGFTPVQDEVGLTTHWLGSIAGVELKLISVAMDRAQRVGGWDQRLRKPKAVTSRVASGSLFYCELADPNADSSANLQAALNTLNGQQIGEAQTWGFGRLCVGRWC